MLWRMEPVAGRTSDRLRAGRIPVDPLASPRADDSLPITTPHEGRRMGARWILPETLLRGN